MPFKLGNLQIALGINSGAKELINMKTNVLAFIGMMSSASS